MDLLQTVLGGLLGGGVIGLIEFLIRRHDTRHDKNQEVLQAIERLGMEVKRLEQKGDERNAIAARVRILRFRDEMLEGRGHSHDSFQQVLRDIDDYDRYCDSHPEFKNNQTVATISHIRKSYEERLEKHDFL